jgi:hypothetical protein
MISILGPQLGMKLAAIALGAGGAFALTGALPASADSLGPFACTDKSGGVAGAAGTVTSVRFAHHDGYDRLVVGFATANAMPQYQLTQQPTSTFIRDASGQPVTLDGSAGIRAVIRNADITPGAPTDQKPALPELREVAQIGDFERVVSYGVGLRTPACFRVLELSGPTRLVIDVATPAAAPTSGSAAPNTAGGSSGSAVQPTTPTDLAATGRPAVPASFPILPLGLALLAVTGGAALLLGRRFKRR